MTSESRRITSRKRVREDSDLHHVLFADTHETTEDLPVISNGAVEFTLGALTPHLTCHICGGFYRDPVTVTECLHTFCKSCLFREFSSGAHYCPDCQLELEPDPFRFALSDRTLQEFLDKVLFPDLKQIDDDNEKDFYAKRNIPLKPEFVDECPKAKSSEKLKWDQSGSRKDSLPPPSSILTDEELEFTLVPDPHVRSHYAMPALVLPCITTSGRLKVVQLKNYIIRKLELPARHRSAIEIVCNGGPVGNELSLTFIVRTMWLDSKEKLKLFYRYAEDTPL